jgi:S-adenosylmethionine:tRNA ribosyltransferase-isomerase
MRLSDFDFHLPEDLIALRPAKPRDSARLLVVDPQTSTLADTIVSHLPTLLRPGDLMVFNDTRTMPVALSGFRPGRGTDSSPVAISLNLHKREAADTWRAFVKKAKRLGSGDVLSFGGGLTAQVVAKPGDGEAVLRFDRAGPALDAALAVAGLMPIPPYIASKRAVDADDAADYQTVYAKAEGSVATPTAGLHFTERLLAALDARGVARAWVTLHVGAGTFLPVKADDVRDHTMHAETYDVPAETADAVNHAKHEGRRIIAVGTTSLRTLESIVDSNGQAQAGAGETSIFITPGYRFRLVDGLMTNFHLPKSTLLMLLSAFAGFERTRAAYAHAIAAGYRFYSYGDAGLYWREDRKGSPGLAPCTPRAG